MPRTQLGFEVPNLGMEICVLLSYNLSNSN
jgi:hypothetical protein